MPNPGLTAQKAREAVDAVSQAVRDGHPLRSSPGPYAIAAAQLGVNERTLRGRVRTAQREFGFIPDLGLQVARESHNAEGAVIARQMVPAREPHVEPDRPLVRNSVLVDAEGGVVQQWRVYGPEGAVTPERLAEIVRGALEAVTPSPALSEPLEGTCEALMNFIPATDAHVGMRAWGAETGADYDVEIARETHHAAMLSLVNRLPKAELAVVLNLGDHLHQNDGRNQTPKSGHILDVDGRFAKVLTAAVQIEIDRVELAKWIHKRVLYRILPGNHDPEAAFAVALALAHHFRDDPRVEVDLSPSAWWFFSWGACLLGACHGDKIKPERMKGYMSDACPEWWGQAKHRHIFYGHWHKQALIADGSTLVECLGTLAARDAWAAAQFTGGRLMQAMTFDRERGLVSRLYHCL